MGTNLNIAFVKQRLQFAELEGGCNLRVLSLDMILIKTELIPNAPLPSPGQRPRSCIWARDGI
jgi:hypothetical protein